MDINVDLERLVAELRRNSKDDAEFAQRVALVCRELVQGKDDPSLAIRTVFRI